MTASVVLLVLGLNVPEYEVPEPEKPERVPPETVTSDFVKSFDDSFRVKLIVALSPIPSELTSASRAMLGVWVAADSSRLLMPADE